MKHVAILLGALVVVGFGAVGSAAAAHSPDVTDVCTYEFGLTGDTWENTIDDTPEQDVVDDVVDTVTNDGTFNWGGCLWWFPDSGNPDNAPADAEVWNMVEQGRNVDGEYNTVQVSVVDDVHGAGTIGAHVCSDVDNNYVACETDKGEFDASFCDGNSAVLSHDGDADDDGHSDFGFGFVVFLNGPLAQTMDCSESDVSAVGAISGGVLDPAAGIFLTLSST